MPAALDACLHWGCALPLPAGEGGQWGWLLFFNSLCTQQQDRAPLAAPAAGAALSQAAQNRLLLLSGMKLQTQPGLMYPSRSSSGSIWLSDGVLLDVASLLPLLRGWSCLSYCSHVCSLGPHPAVPPQQGADLSSIRDSHDLPGKPPSVAGLQLYEVLPMMWCVWNLF